MAEIVHEEPPTLDDGKKDKKSKKEKKDKKDKRNKNGKKVERYYLSDVEDEPSD